MVEWLAMPATGAAPITLDAWADGFSLLGHAPSIIHDGSGVAWLEVATQQLRGYAVIEDGVVEAINFELHRTDPAAALALIQAIVEKLGWELHQVEDEEDDNS